MSEQSSSGYSGYSLASAFSATLHSNERCNQLVRDNFPCLSPRGDRVFSVPSSVPPPCDETLPTDLIDWPKKKR